jgi:two-component system cell cycle response regulator DivK
VEAERVGVLSSLTRQKYARVAQWIRAFASGAKGRRFDPCRGYHDPSRPFHLVQMVNPQSIENAQRTILVVDDFDDTRRLMRTWLERKGFRVIEAENGLQAVTEAENEIPDLIIMDIEMPELDGLSATREIRRMKGLEATPVLAVSAYGDEQFRGKALAAGCNEYVSTPFDPAELERLIRLMIH